MKSWVSKYTLYTTNNEKYQRVNKLQQNFNHKFRDRSFFTREGELVEFGGPCEKNGFRGGHPKKIREIGGAT